METVKKKTNFIEETQSNYKKGIDYQREIFKQANLEMDFDTMVKALENIKIEIKSKVVQSGNKDAIIRIQKIIEWYYNLPTIYQRNTENGHQTIYPNNIHIKISRNLRIAYELLIQQLNKLDLI